MAIRRPRCYHRKVASSPPRSVSPSFSEDDPTIINAFSSPKYRVMPFITEPGRRRYNIAERRSSRASSRASSTAPSEYAEDLEDAPLVGEDSPSLLEADYDNILDALEFGNSNPSGESDWHKKRCKQWQHWSTEIIPSLINPYLSYLEASSSLQSKPQLSSSYHCHGGCQVKTIKVACVYFDCRSSLVYAFLGTDSLLGLEAVTLSHCSCTSVPIQLIHRGLFGCAPVAPTLAVDLRVLQFLRTLFVRITPNITAWCDAVESFMDGLGYKLDNLVSHTILSCCLH
jgi:hypothetical protein